MGEARVSPDNPSRLDESAPSVGLTILFDGREWQVTGQSSYWTDEGYRVHEWCCEAGDTTAYLLKEGDPEHGTIRWFFTREIDGAVVAVAGGERLGEWLRRTTDATPPEALTYQATPYRYADTTEGTHEDDSGTRVRKTTWDYWDGGHAHNLAVERWPDGSFDCYLGAYIEADQVTIRPAAAQKGFRPRLQANPFLAAAVFLPLAYFVAFIAGRPFDESMTFALPVAAAIGWMLALPLAPAAGLAALIAVPVAAGVFLRFPPLTSEAGLVALFGIPAAIGWLARRRGYAGRRLAVQYAAAFGLAAPLLGVGFYSYFRLAPGPHTADQLVLALGPAALGSLAGFLVSGLVLGREE